MWAQRVPLTALFEVQALADAEVALDFLRFCTLQPKKTPHWLAEHVGTALGPFPSDFDFLVRTSDFGSARFFRGSPFLGGL